VLARLYYRLGPRALSLRRDGTAAAAVFFSLFVLASGILWLAGGQPTAAPLALAASPSAVAVSATTDHVYLATFTKNIVWALDGAGGHVLGGIQLEAGTLALMAVNPTTEHVYVVNLPHRIDVLAGTTMTLLTSLVLDGYPDGLAVDPVTNRVYVAIQSDPWRHAPARVVVMNGWNDSFVAEVPVGRLPLAVAANATTNRVYVANAAENTVSVIDGRTNAVLATIPVGPFPRALAVNPGTNLVYVGNRDNHSVSVVDGRDNAVVATVAVEGSPGAMAVNETTNRVYVAGDAGAVSVLDGTTNRVTTTLAAGPLPSGMAVNAKTNRVYVTSAGDNTVRMLQDHRFGLPQGRVVAGWFSAPVATADPMASCLCDRPPTEQP